MKKNLSLVVIALLLTLALSMAAMPVSAQPKVRRPVNSFLGNWTATDLSDGSSLKLTIRAEFRITSVKFADSSFALCGGLPATGTGVGRATGNIMHTQINIFCSGARTPVRTNVDLFLTLTSKTTMHDIAGNVYTYRGACGIK